MKLLSRTTLVLCATLMLLVPAVIVFWTPAQAQLGNSGVPVSCSAGVIASPAIFTCKVADGTVFVNNRVPAGYYFHVTDVIIAPSTTADTQAVVEAEDANDSAAGSLVLQTSSFGTQGQHFTSPALVLPTQYRLRALSFNGPGFIAEVYGLLTKNVTYVPLIVR